MSLFKKNTKNIIPAMEENSQIMYQQIAAVRKGIKNMFKNALTWRKPKDVKAVMEGIVAIAAEQLKKTGSFKLAGALNLKLKKKQPSQHVRV